MKQKNGKKTACELEKEYAMEGISKKCNWDLADIRQFYLRETCIDKGTCLSRKMKEYKIFFSKYQHDNKESFRIKELNEKLRGN